MHYQDLVARIHAHQFMFALSLSDECTEQIVHHGEVRGAYPHAFPAKLLLGWCKGCSLHVVAAEDSFKQLVIVITAYEPALNKWEPDRKTRRKRS